jgi:hypothetical protein
VKNRVGRVSPDKWREFRKKRTDWRSGESEKDIDADDLIR